MSQGLVASPEAKGMEQILPWSLQREHGPANTWILDYQPQNWETLLLHCWYFRPLNSWYFRYSSHRKQVYHASLCALTKWRKGLFLQEHLKCTSRNVLVDFIIKSCHLRQIVEVLNA